MALTELTELTERLSSSPLDCNYPVAPIEGAVGVKVRARVGRFTHLYVRYPDRVEDHIAEIVTIDGTQMLKPFMLQGVNYRPTSHPEPAPTNA